MGNIKDYFWDEFFNEYTSNGQKKRQSDLWLEIDEPLWFKASGTKATNGKQGDTRNSNKVDKQSWNECDCCLDGPTTEPITNSTGTKIIDKFFWDVNDTATEAIAVLLKKHDDYGPANISEAPGGAVNGLAVRLHDKVARLSNLVKTGNDPKNESIYDTFLDIANYGLIGMLVLKGKWDSGD